MNKNKVLMKFEKNWADEFTVSGFKIISWDEYQNLKKLVSENGHLLSNFCFGTNEGFEDKTINELFQSSTFTVIDPQEASIIERLFGEEFGIVPELQYCVDEDDFDDEELDDE